MAKKIYCNKCGALMRILADMVICDECGNDGWIEDDGTVTQRDDGEFHCDVFEDAIGTSMAEACEYFGDSDDEDDYDGGSDDEDDLMD